MSRNYDNWERLVAAVIKRQQIWELCHQHSTTPSICSEASSSDFSSSFRSSDGMFENNADSALKPLPKLNSLRGVVRGDILGKGRFGTSYLTELRRDILPISDPEFLVEGNRLVMKELLMRKVKVKEKEFKIAFGNYRHENVAAPRAYYFSIEGNFIFNDYHSQGSLYDLLHGRSGDRLNWKSRVQVAVEAARGKSEDHLNWESRVKIAVGAARGIAHIHSQCDGKQAHGNVRSSNIFLNSEKYGCVSDYGLAAVMEMSGEVGALYYHASVYEFKNASHESDVYSFGVVLLELVTGKSPMAAHGSRKDLHIVAWARSIRPEDWSSKLFYRRVQRNEPFGDEVEMLEFIEESNIELGGYSGMNIMVLGEIISSHLNSVESELEETMKVAMRCLARLPQDRPKMIAVVFMLESIANYGKILSGLY